MSFQASTTLKSTLEKRDGAAHTEEFGYGLSQEVTEKNEGGLKEVNQNGYKFLSEINVIIHSMKSAYMRVVNHKKR